MQFNFILIILFVVLNLALLIAVYAAFWKIFTKAGRPGWAAIIPIYNLVILLEIAGKPWWWIFLMLIPIANLVVIIMMYHGLSTNFGKDVGFTIGLVLLSAVFIMILGFGNAQYIGPPPADGMKTA